MSKPTKGLTGTSKHLRLVEGLVEAGATAAEVRTKKGRTQGKKQGFNGKQSPNGKRGTGCADLTDGQCVILAQQGDTRAQEQLYRRHARFAYNLAARIAGSSSDVEDVVHDAFIKAFNKLNTLREPQAFRRWLGSIVVYGMRSRLRRAKLARVLGLSRGNDQIDIDHVASRAVSPQTRAELAQLYALLQTLPANDRIAWTLRYVEGHDLKQAAELTDCSLATVKRRIRRAQQFLEAHFVRTDLSDAAESDDSSADPENRAAAGNLKL